MSIEKKEVCDLFFSINEPEVLDADFNIVKSCCSAWGNDAWSITDEDIQALKNGKILYLNDGEYCHFVMYKGE